MFMTCIHEVPFSHFSETPTAHTQSIIFPALSPGECRHGTANYIKTASFRVRNSLFTITELFVSTCSLSLMESLSNHNQISAGKT